MIWSCKLTWYYTGLPPLGQLLSRRGNLTGARCQKRFRRSVEALVLVSGADTLLHRRLMGEARGQSTPIR